MGRHFQRFGIAAALVIVALATCAQGASAATKDYSLTIAPANVNSGVLVDISATFKNLTRTQQLGSVNLTPPDGYAVQGIASFSRPAPATAAVADGIVQLRDLSLTPGQSATVTMTVMTPCSPGVTSPWTALVKQANDFNGSPGNDLALSPAQSSVTTTTMGACVPCVEDDSCDTGLGGTGSGLSLLAPPNLNQADAGLLTISLPAAGLDCAGYAERAASTYRFDAPTTRGKVGVLTYDASTRRVTSRDPLEVCFGSPVAFAVKAKTEQTTTVLDGQTIYVGRLPNCFGLTPPPCVTERDDALRQITFTMPAGDPYSR
jgi:hypothetical protein